jgi:hypothetical protein
MQLQISCARRAKRYSVAFDAATKTKLHHHLNQMREIVAGSSDTPGKKHALSERINDLAAEIDKDRTRFEHLAALAIQVAETAGTMAEKLEPLTRTIMTIVGRSKAHEDEQARLPAPKERRQIEGPKGTAKTKGKPVLGPAKRTFLEALDDEIPF